MFYYVIKRNEQLYKESISNMDVFKCMLLSGRFPCFADQNGGQLHVTVSVKPCLVSNPGDNARVGPCRRVHC